MRLVVGLVEELISIFLCSANFFGAVTENAVDETRFSGMGVSSEFMKWMLQTVECPLETA